MYWSQWQALTMEEKDQEIRNTYGFLPHEHVNSQDHENYISSFVKDDPPSKKKGGKKTRRRRRQNRKSKTKRGKKSRKTRTKRK